MQKDLLSNEAYRELAREQTKNVPSASVHEWCAVQRVADGAYVDVTIFVPKPSPPASATVDQLRAIQSVVDGAK